MRQAQWILGLVGVDANVYVGQWVQSCQTAGGGIFPSLDLMYPTLESAPLPLEIAPYKTVQLFSACAPLEVLVLGYASIFYWWYASFALFSAVPNFLVWFTAALCSISKGRTISGTSHGVL